MNRSKYFNFIEEKLSFLAYRIEIRGSLNLLDLNLHSENFYLHFFNLLFGWELVNLNTVKENIAGIDLVDTTNNVVVQVSSLATFHKIESSLNKELSDYQGYSFKFISISKNAKHLRTKTYTNPHNLIFSPQQDIWDIEYLLGFIRGLDIGRLQEVYEFIKKEIKDEIDPRKVESNLTKIIIILAKEDWSQRKSDFEINDFDIEAKISYNQLNRAKILIDDYKYHHHRIEKIYSEFDKQGVNKSISILDGIRSEYIALEPMNSPDQCFFSIINKVTNKVLKSTDHLPMPKEELDLCVRILVVDAFIRCKIFKNPMENNNAHS
ncbi:MAG: SMEK domain-containing protein [Deltaproteobacteria bacterium]|nr:SMEK domain-containing protein [Deltaproteobacteria bacterium]